MIPAPWFWMTHRMRVPKSVYPVTQDPACMSGPAACLIHANGRGRLAPQLALAGAICVEAAP